MLVSVTLVYIPTRFLILAPPFVRLLHPSIKRHPRRADRNPTVRPTPPSTRPPHTVTLALHPPPTNTLNARVFFLLRTLWCHRTKQEREGAQIWVVTSPL